MTTEPIAVIRSYPELLEAFRAVKAQLGLSNTWCDETCDFQQGYTDKILGPTQQKNISPLTFSMFCQIFAVRFTMEIDLDAARKMEGVWQRREEGKVAFPEWRISKKLVQKATPYVFSEMGKRSAPARMASLTAEHRSRIARKAAKSRWRKHRKAEREKRALLV